MTATFAPLALRCPRCGEPVNPALRPGRGKPFRVKRQCSTLYGCQRYFVLVGRVYFTHSTHRSVEVTWVESDSRYEVPFDAWTSTPCVRSQSSDGVDNLHDERPCPECAEVDRRITKLEGAQVKRSDVTIRERDLGWVVTRDGLPDGSFETAVEAYFSVKEWANAEVRLGHSSIQTVTWETETILGRQVANVFVNEGRLGRVATTKEGNR